MAKMIYRPLEIMPFGTNCYLVASEQTRDGMVIDPAGDASRILSNIRELDLKIGLIVVTHTHPDHIGAIRQVVENTGASFAVHQPRPKTCSIMTSADSLPGIRPSKSHRHQTDCSKMAIFLVVGDLKFQVLHTPGHSPGGICIVGYGVVFSGDALFNRSIGRTDGPGGDSNLLISNIRAKLLILPDQTVVLPGHGPKTTIGRERRNNPFLR